MKIKLSLSVHLLLYPLGTQGRRLSKEFNATLESESDLLPGSCTTRLYGYKELILVIGAENQAETMGHTRLEIPQRLELLGWRIRSVEA